MAKPKFQIPKTLGACADLLYQLHQEKAEAAKVVAEISERATKLEELLISKLSTDDAEGVEGKVAKVRILPETYPMVETQDWPKVYAYIKKEGAFDLLNKKLNSKAVRERWENGERIPGVKKFNDKKVSLTKK